MGFFKRRVIGVFKLSPNYFSFISAVFISISVNLYTTVAVAKSIAARSARYQYVLAGSVLLFISGLFSSILAWNLESISRLALRQTPGFMNEQEVWEKLVLGRFRRLFFYLLCAMTFAMLGLAILWPI